jgi:hypothetical protein
MQMTKLLRKAPETTHIEPLAVDIPTACRMTGVGRSMVYMALNPNSSKRDGLPFLPSFKVGKLRRITMPNLKAWVAELAAQADVGGR